MTSFLDPSDLIGDARGGMLDPSDFLNSPELRRRRAFDALSGMAQGLIAASAPSPYPRDAFGSAISGALGATSEDKYLKRAMVGSQLAKNRQEMANDKAWRDMFNGAGSVSPAPAPADAATAPSPSGGGGAPAANQQQYVEMMMPLALEISKQTGLDPKLVIAQSALETGWGTKAPGNNYFGIKSHGQPGGQTLATTEAGPGGELVPTQASFRAYVAPGASAQDYIQFIKGNQGRYAPVMAAQGLDAQIDAMGKSGYATDPNYGTKLRQIAMSLPQPGAPQVAQGGGDASGNPIQPAQYTPPGQAPQQAFRPQTMQDVVQTIPPGVRQMIGAMGRKEGMGVLMKYADPGSEAVLDTQTNQIVFIPKTMVGRDPRYVPAKVAELDIQRQQLANSQRKTDIDERNADVTIGNDGKPVVNQTVVDAKKAVSAAQGTDPSSKITVELAQDAIKRNSEWQNAGVKAQSSIGRLGALQTMLDQISTNKFKGTTTQLKAAAKAAGIDLDAMGIKDDVGVTQAAEALTNMLALENRDPSGGAGMPGAMSDADREFLKAVGPSITGDPAGNKIKIAIKKGDLQRSVDIAKFAREYIKSEEFKKNPAGLDDYVAEKIAGKSYYDPSILQVQKNATDDYLTNGLPKPPPGSSIPGQAGGGLPPPPPGTRIIR